MRSVFRRRVLSFTVIAAAAWPGAAAAAPAGWSPLPDMADGRNAHVAAPLADGDVLVAGGFAGATTEIAGAERFDVATGTWSAAGQLLPARHYAAATTLADGRVLVTGGVTNAGVTDTARIYDPATNAWTAAAPMLQARNGHTATLLADGRVLVAGGTDGTRNATRVAELYDPVTDTWTATGSLSTGRENHTATLLPDGEVLVVGGYDSAGATTFYDSAERYDPATGTWSAAAPMGVARAQHGAALLASGQVLVTGGVSRSGVVRSAQRLDPATDSWSAQVAVAGTGNVTTSVPLLDGGALSWTDGNARSLRFDPATGASTPAGGTAARRLPTVTRLADGRVLVAGGVGDGGVRLRSAEVYTPETTRAVTGTDLGEATVGQATERDVVVRAAGAGRLFPGTATVSGNEVSVLADDCAGRTLVGADTCVVRVRFAPSAAGARTAQLDLADNGGGAVTLTGTGIAAPVTEPDPTPTATATPGSGTAPAPLPASPAPATTPVPAVPAAASCRSRRVFTVNLRVPRRSGLRRAVATLDGKRVATLRGQRRSFRLDLRGRPAGTYRLRIVTRTVAGARRVDVRRYRTCAPGA